MPRSIWEGSISFGLVHIPIGLSTTKSKKSIAFHQLHDEDHVRIKQVRTCPADGKEIPYENIVKGYEIAKDQYVVVTQEELEGLAPEKSSTIELEKFVHIDDIDPLFFESSYYVNPKPASVKPYDLLRDAMKKSERAGIARFVMRQKEYLVAIWPRDEKLVLTTLKFADEVAEPEVIAPAKDAKPRKKGELEAAQQLVDALADEFDPTEYTDEYREAVLAMIEAKAEGKQISIQPATPAKATPAPDLMAALERSIAAAVGESKPKKKRARTESATHAAATKRSTNGSGPAKKASTQAKRKPVVAGSKSGGGGSRKK